MNDNLPDKFNFSCYDKVYTAEIFNKDDEDNCKFKIKSTNLSETLMTECKYGYVMNCVKLGDWKIINTIEVKQEPVSLLERGDRITMKENNIVVFSHLDNSEVHFFNYTDHFMDWYNVSYMNEHILYIHKSPLNINQIFHMELTTECKYEHPKHNEINECNAKIRKLQESAKSINEQMTQERCKLEELTK